MLERCEIRRRSEVNFLWIILFPFSFFSGDKAAAAFCRLALKLMVIESCAVQRIGELWISRVAALFVRSSSYLGIFYRIEFGNFSFHILFPLRENRSSKMTLNPANLITRARIAFSHLRCSTNNLFLRVVEALLVFRASWDFPRKHFPRIFEIAIKFSYHVTR